jgi:hypothetical protein
MEIGFGNTSERERPVIVIDGVESPSERPCRHFPADHNKPQRRPRTPGTNVHVRIKNHALRFVKTSHIGHLRPRPGPQWRHRGGHELCLTKLRSAGSDRTASPAAPEMKMYAAIMVRHASGAATNRRRRGRQCRGAAVTTMSQRGKGGSAEAVVADLAVGKCSGLHPSL